MFRLTPVVKNLLIINVLFFLAKEMFGLEELALYFIKSDLFAPYQIVTHFFMHANLMHLFFNMFALAMFGSTLEATWGSKRLLIFYFLCAFGSFALHTAFTYYQYYNLVGQMSSMELEMILREGTTLLSGGKNWVGEAGDLNLILNTPTVGASGAIFGLLVGFAMLFPNTELMLIFPPIPVKAKYMIPFFIAIDLFLGVNQFSWDNIAHFAHLGGALMGFLLIYFRKV